MSWFFSHQRRKRLEKAQDFFVKTKIKTKTCVFVLEAPRDQDLGLEDYITGSVLMVLRPLNVTFWNIVHIVSNVWYVLLHHTYRSIVTCYTSLGKCCWIRYDPMNEQLCSVMMPRCLPSVQSTFCRFPFVSTSFMDCLCLVAQVKL